MSKFRAHLSELLAKAWAGERLVVVHRPGNGKARRFLICRESNMVKLSDEQLCEALMIHIAFNQHCNDMTAKEALNIIAKLFPKEIVGKVRQGNGEESKKQEEEEENETRIS